MAGSPEWKVYDKDGTYQACCKDLVAAAVLTDWYGAGSTIRWQHSLIVWTEGTDGHSCESFDVVVMTGTERLRQHHAITFSRSYPSSTRLEPRDVYSD